MTFKVTIEQTKDESVHLGKEWRLLDADRYGYTPEDDTTRTVTKTIYEQTVETLNVWGVITAVNGGSK